MSELDIPSATESTTLPSTTTEGLGATLPAQLEEKSASGEVKNGHGAGYDGLSSATSHANKNGNQVKCVTVAIVGAGQRGQVRSYHHTVASCELIQPGLGLCELCP